MRRTVPTTLLALFATTALAGDWPGFLGPNGNGKSPETKLLDAWPAGGPKEVWRARAGVGMSGVAVAETVVTLGHQDGRQCVLSYDKKSGALLKSVPVAPAYRNAMGNGPRATPTLDGDHAFVFTGEGVLAKVDVAKGAVEWSHNVPGELGGEPAEYGMSSSPLLTEKHVVVIAGAPGATVVAYDRTSGKLAWKAGNDPCGYASPALLEVGGRKQIVAAAGNAVLGLDPANGTVLWRYPWVTDFNCNTANPVAVDGKVLVSSGENHGSVLLDVSGKTPKVVWSTLGPKAVLRSEWQTPVLLGDHLYGMDNVGGAGPITHLVCLKAPTGEVVWREPRFGKGNFVAVDGKLFLTLLDGSVAAVKATPQGFEELGRKKVVGKTRQAPALADGRLYVRDDAEIVCLDVNAE